MLQVNDRSLLHVGSQRDNVTGASGGYFLTPRQRSWRGVLKLIGQGHSRLVEGLPSLSAEKQPLIFPF